MKSRSMSLIRDLVPKSILKQIGLIVFARYCQSSKSRCQEDDIVSNPVYQKLIEKLDDDDDAKKKTISIRKGLQVALDRKSNFDLSELINCQAEMLTIPMIKTIVFERSIELAALVLDRIKIGLPISFLDRYLVLENRDWSVIDVLCDRCGLTVTEKLRIFLDNKSFWCYNFFFKMKTQIEAEMKDLDDLNFPLFLKFVRIWFHFIRFRINLKILSTFEQRIRAFAKTKTAVEWDQLLLPLVVHKWRVKNGQNEQKDLCLLEHFKSRH